MTDPNHHPDQPAGALVDSLGCTLQLEPGDIPYGAIVLVACNNNEHETVLRHGTSLGLDYFGLRGMLAEAVDNTTGWPDA